MNGLRAEGQQLGAVQTETVAHPGECRHFGHATKLHSFNSHNTDEDPRFEGAHPCDWGIPWGLGWGVGVTDTRHETIVLLYGWCQTDWSWCPSA